MMKNKIIFMDVDGVLNYTKWYRRKPINLFEQDRDIDPECVRRIVNICERTGAKIVLSSDWRIDKNSIGRLERAGFPEGLIFSQTPELIWTRFNSPTSTEDYSRGREIDMWLNEHPDTYDYVIIDDCEDFSDEQKRFHYIHVNPYIGFTDKNMEDTICILSR